MEQLEPEQLKFVEILAKLMAEKVVLSQGEIIARMAEIRARQGDNAS